MPYQPDAVRRFAPLMAAFFMLVLVIGNDSPAQSRGSAPAADRAQVPRKYTSKSFLLYTDLADADAKELLNRLESMLGFVARYWGRPHRGVIEMYVAENLDDWPSQVLNKMAPSGIASIRSGGGLTIGAVMVRGNQFRSKAVVYAVAKHGIPQHEAVHAYCDHAFGGTGPVWYSEGMAEVGNYWRNGEKGVGAPRYVIRYLKSAPTKKLDAIVNNPLEQTGDSWQNYAWRWALCHLLGHNENYTKRFKPLGLQLLTRKKIDFWQVYGTQAEEINFEYRQFLQDMTPGYRVDLCSWDWKTRFAIPTKGRTMTAKIAADRGWQGSRLAVAAGTEYEYSASGNWSTEENGTDVDGDGTADGRGRLQGVVFSDYALSEPFELGTFGTFTAPADGKLYLRCSDDWGAIADNSGSLTVRTKIKGSGRPLINPNEEPSKPDPSSEEQPPPDSD